MHSNQGTGAGMPGQGLFPMSIIPQPPVYTMNQQNEQVIDQNELKKDKKRVIAKNKVTFAKDV